MSVSVWRNNSSMKIYLIHKNTGLFQTINPGQRVIGNWYSKFSPPLDFVESIYSLDAPESDPTYIYYVMGNEADSLDVDQDGIEIQHLIPITQKGQNQFILSPVPKNPLAVKVILNSLVQTYNIDYRVLSSMLFWSSDVPLEIGDVLLAWY